MSRDQRTHLSRTVPDPRSGPSRHSPPTGGLCRESYTLRTRVASLFKSHTSFEKTSVNGNKMSPSLTQGPYTCTLNGLTILLQLPRLGSDPQERGLRTLTRGPAVGPGEPKVVHRQHHDQRTVTEKDRKERRERTRREEETKTNSKESDPKRRKREDRK